MSLIPSLFISHGSPDIKLREHEIKDFFLNLSSKIKKPKNIIIISAHWISEELEILTNKNPELIYDCYGFSEELYETKYPIKNDLNLVNDIIKKFRQKDIKINPNPIRSGYDHGVWSVLSLIYPDANIPVVQISLPSSYNIKQLLNLGEVLKSFRKESLIIGSGNTTHNLGDISWSENTQIKPYAKEFRDYLTKYLNEGNIEKLKDLNSIPKLRENHPTLEHLLPLFINIGSSNDKKAESMIESYMFGNLAMDTYIFKN